jgi:hypothetical protein
MLSNKAKQVFIYIDVDLIESDIEMMYEVNTQSVTEVLKLYIENEPTSSSNIFI